MADIQDYTSGRILEEAGKALAVLLAGDEPLQGTKIGGRLVHEINKFEPLRLTMEQAAEIIAGSSFCAVGDRICRKLAPESDATEAVFLNELGKAMAAAGKAVQVTPDEAVAVLGRYHGKPLVMSKVGGSHMEICRTNPKTCLYWNMKRRGLDCMKPCLEGVKDQGPGA